MIENNVRIRLVETAGRPCAEALERSTRLMRKAGFSVLHDPVAEHPDYPLYAAADAVRAENLTRALTETVSDVVVAARGGYGSSTLLKSLDWDAILSSKPKLLVGFSDVSAIHCALLTRAGRVGLHGPMPGSALFCRPEDTSTPLTELLATDFPWSSQLSLTARKPLSNALSGWLFGGNLAVLSGLIGTPWFPPDLSGAIVFLEDVGENGGRLGRYFDQWVDSGKSQGIRALVLGTFTDAGKGAGGLRDNIVAEIERRASCPVFVTDQIGHCPPNLPIPIGVSASIEPTADEQTGTLRWQLQTLSADPAFSNTMAEHV